jgi:hypothetical protein
MYAQTPLLHAPGVVLKVPYLARVPRTGTSVDGPSALGPRVQASISRSHAPAVSKDLPLVPRVAIDDHAVHPHGTETAECRDGENSAQHRSGPADPNQGFQGTAIGGGSITALLRSRRGTAHRDPHEARSYRMQDPTRLIGVPV